MIDSSRRGFLKQGAGVAASVSMGAMGTPLLASQLRTESEVSNAIQNSVAKELVKRAVSVATQEGAQYADARMTHTRHRLFINLAVQDMESMTVGVRALVNGYWGFASGPVWSDAEMVRLGKAAVAQAKSNALGKERIVELAPRPVVIGKHWTMPVKRDPFDVHPSEVRDMMDGVAVYTGAKPYASGGVFRVSFTVQDKNYADSDGASYSQKTYLSSGICRVSYTKGADTFSTILNSLSPTGMGYELFDEERLRNEVDLVYEEELRDLSLPIQPVEVGRFDTLFSGAALGGIAARTLASATELDRAMGFEANATGTSYLNAPKEMAGSYVIGSPLINIKADRNSLGGAATVAWDDEAVVPRTFDLVEEGIFKSYQTTRESAAWLKSDGIAVSNGSAYAPEGVDMSLCHSGNLSLQPSDTNLSLDDLSQTMDSGLLFPFLNINTSDFQQLNGIAAGSCFELKNGKKIARIIGAGILFRAPEFWKSIKKIGGESSVVRIGHSAIKGQPRQSANFSVTAPAGMAEKLAIIDLLRKA